MEVIIYYLIQIRIRISKKIRKREQRSYKEVGDDTK
jgi:hypothetical protein